MDSGWAGDACMAWRRLEGQGCWQLFCCKGAEGKSLPHVSRYLEPLDNYVLSDTKLDWADFLG